MPVHEVTNTQDSSPDVPVGLVSIVVPVFNGERHLLECLESIVQQSYQPIEIVVSNSGSTDGSDEIIRSLGDNRIRYLPIPDQRLTVHENWERALREARGEFVKLVCQDDLLAPRCLESQVKLLAAFPEASMAVCRRMIIDVNGGVLIRKRGLGNLIRRSSPRVVAAAELARACARAGTNLLGEPACVLFRTSSLPDQLFDSQWRFTMDLDLYFRYLVDGFAILDDAVLASFRVSSQQLSANLAKHQARESRRFFADLGTRMPGTITTFDLTESGFRSALLSQARTLLYRIDRLRNRVGRNRRS